MRTAITFVFCILICGAVFYAGTVKPWEQEDGMTTIPIVPLQGRPGLDEFLATVNPEIMKQCVHDHDQGRPIDLDYLATCADFDLYAEYIGISKFEAVKKFEYVMLHSSSKLEFEDRLAR